MEEEFDGPGQLFQQLQGQVFHTIKNIGGKNYMHRYRIGTDGKFTLEEKLLGAYLSGKQVQNIIKEAGNEVRFLRENMFVITSSTANFDFLCH